jgi:hypothetical protein
MIFKLGRTDFKDLVAFWLIVLAVGKGAANGPAEPSQGRVAGEPGRFDIPTIVVSRMNASYCEVA